MQKMVWLGCLALIGGMMTLTSTSVIANEPVPSISDIMVELNNSKKGIHPKFGKLLKGKSEIKWETLTDDAKLYADLAAALGKNKPEKGDEASWKKLCSEYAADAKALSEAVAKKDLEGLKKAHAKLSKSCGPCHDAHQP